MTTNLTPITVRHRQLKSESDRERVYDVDLSNNTTAHDFEFLVGDKIVGAVRVLPDGTRIPLDEEIPLAAPYTMGDAWEAIKAWPWWAHATWGATSVEVLHLIARRP